MNSRAQLNECVLSPLPRYLNIFMLNIQTISQACHLKKFPPPRSSRDEGEAEEVVAGYQLTWQKEQERATRKRMLAKYDVNEWKFHKESHHFIQWYVLITVVIKETTSYSKHVIHAPRHTLFPPTFCKKSADCLFFLVIVCFLIAVIKPQPKATLEGNGLFYFTGCSLSVREAKARM